MHFAPQRTFICSPDGQLLVDIVGLYETLEDDFGLIQKFVNGADSDLRAMNRTTMRNEEYKKQYQETA